MSGHRETAEHFITNLFDFSFLSSNIFLVMLVSLLNNIIEPRVVLYLIVELVRTAALLKKETRTKTRINHILLGPSLPINRRR